MKHHERHPGWRAAEWLSTWLDESERDAVIGDLDETHASSGRACLEVAGLVVRRACESWLRPSLTAGMLVVIAVATLHAEGLTRPSPPPAASLLADAPAGSAEEAFVDCTRNYRRFIKDSSARASALLVCEHSSSVCLSNAVCALPTPTSSQHLVHESNMQTLHTLCCRRPPSGLLNGSSRRAALPALRRPPRGLA